MRDFNLFYNYTDFNMKTVEFKKYLKRENFILIKYE